MEEHEAGQEREKEKDNLYAHSIAYNRTIFIKEAVSGRKGYLCLGCHNEMEAVKSQKIKEYFRHAAKDVPIERRCSYAQESYRHKLAMDFLQRLKKVKVPTLYKYPPKGENGPPIKLQDAKFVEAHEVHNNRCFYENENCEIVQGKPPDENTPFIRPDVTFFDKSGNPILFIEIVATHKLSDENKVIYMRMGIDTIQISVPKDSPEAIEKVLTTTNHTKWIYSYEEANTQYISFSGGDREGISDIDIEQRRLFEESVSCRKSRIANLVRRINRCLSEESYLGVENAFRGEIQRIEKLTDECEDEQRAVRSGIDKKFRERRERIEKERIRITKEENDFENSFKREVEREIGIAESDLRGKIWEVDGTYKQEETKYRDLEGRYTRKASEIESDLTDIRTKIGAVEADIKYIPRATRVDTERIESIRRSIQGLPSLEERTRQSILTTKEAIRTESEAIERSEFLLSQEGIQATRFEMERIFEQEKRDLENKYIEEERRVTTIIHERDFRGNDEFTRTCKKLFNELGLWKNWDSLEEQRRRIESARNCIRKGDYKNWND